MWGASRSHYAPGRETSAFDRARQRFEQALAHYPAFENAQVGLGRTLVTLGRPVEALPHLKAVVARNPDNEVALYQIAQAWRTLGNAAAQQQALADFSRARERSSVRRSAVPQPPTDVTPQVLDLQASK